MKNIDELVQQGKIADALTALRPMLREDPTNTDMNIRYIELLCVAGEYEKADSQLEKLVRREPDYLVGAVNLRHLIRAETARQSFRNGCDSARYFGECDEAFESLVRLRLELAEGHIENAEAAAHDMETARRSPCFRLNGTREVCLRDLDDSYGGYLEIIGTDGEFYLACLTEIEHLQLYPPESLLDMIWRRAEISIQDGPSGEAFIPMIYPDSETGNERVGRETNWDTLAPGLVMGRGQKMFLVGEEALPLSDIHSLELIAAEETPDPQAEAVLVD